MSNFEPAKNLGPHWDLSSVQEVVDNNRYVVTISYGLPAIQWTEILVKKTDSTGRCTEVTDKREI